MLKGKGRHVDADFHIHAFLPDGKLKVLWREFGGRNSAGAKFFDGIIAERVHGVAVIQLAEAKREFPLCLQTSEKFAHPGIFRGRTEIYGMLVKRMVNLFVYRRAVIVKDAIQVVADIVLTKMPLAVCSQSVSSNFRRMLAPKEFGTLAEESAINENRGFRHNTPPLTIKSPWIWHSPDRGGSIPKA